MFRLVYTPQAKRDLNEIRSYIAQRSGHSTAGLDFTTKIRVECKKLASFENMLGVARPELGQGLRAHPFGNYVIMLRYDESLLEIVTIIEGHRDIDALFDGT